LSFGGHTASQAFPRSVMHRWYNFDPCSYLECGVRGSLGGYTEDEVIVLIPPEDGASADSPVVPVNCLTWDQFADLLWCGAVYE
jgi:hypothetical protein